MHDLDTLTNSCTIDRQCNRSWFSYILYSSGTPTKKLKKHGIGNKLPKDIDFAQLLSHFSAIQALHDEERRKEVSDDVVTEEEAEKLFEMKLSETENAEFL